MQHSILWHIANNGGPHTLDVMTDGDPDAITLHQFSGTSASFAIAKKDASTVTITATVSGVGDRSFQLTLGSTQLNVTARVEAAASGPTMRLTGQNLTLDDNGNYSASGSMGGTYPVTVVMSDGSTPTVTATVADQLSSVTVNGQQVVIDMKGVGVSTINIVAGGLTKHIHLSISGAAAQTWANFQTVDFTTSPPGHANEGALGTYDATNHLFDMPSFAAPKPDAVFFFRPTNWVMTGDFQFEATLTYVDDPNNIQTMGLALITKANSQRTGYIFTIQGASLNAYKITGTGVVSAAVKLADVHELAQNIPETLKVERVNGVWQFYMNGAKVGTTYTDATNPYDDFYPGIFTQGAHLKLTQMQLFHN